MKLQVVEHKFYFTHFQLRSFYELQLKDCVDGRNFILRDGEEIEKKKFAMKGKLMSRERPSCYLIQLMKCLKFHARKMGFRAFQILR